MSNFPILDLVAGIIFIFFLLSIICSSVVEIILTTKKIRSKVLGEWITGMFNIDIPGSMKKDASGQDIPGTGKKLGEELIDHCALTALSGEGQPPSYIDAKNFVSALLEKITLYGPATKDTILNVPNKIDEYMVAIKDSPILPQTLQRTLITYATEAKDTYQALTTKTVGELEMFRAKIEHWYDTNMDRVSGTLKQNHTRPLTMIIAIFAVLFLNADSIEISKYLYNNPQARAELAAQAYSTGKDDSIRKKMEVLKAKVPDSVKLTVAQAVDNINEKLGEVNEAKAALNGSIPLGWTNLNPGWENIRYEGVRWLLFILLKLIGLTVTVLAIMMGAPFWFDVLNKISNLRGSGTKPASSTDDSK